MSGPHDPLHVTNYFIGRGLNEGPRFTPIQVQKLVYFAHGWMLGIHHRPLLESKFEAWLYGPVMPEVYHNLSYYRGNPAEAEVLAHAKDFDEDEADILDQVFNVYGKFTGVEPSGMTGAKDGPWDRTWRKHKRQAVIPNNLIEKHFASILSKQKQPSR